LLFNGSFMPKLIIKIKETIPLLINAIVQGWFSFPPRIRVLLSASATFLLIMIGFIFVLQYQLKQTPVEVVDLSHALISTKKTIEETKPNIEKQTLVIDSTEQAIAADAFDDDDTIIVTKREISEQEMFRISNDWLYPQVQELKRRVKDITISIEKDKKYLEENAYLIEPTKKEIAQLEKEYQRTSAALDLPQLSSNSFHDEMQRRYDDVRVRLTAARKKLAVLEQVVASTERRKTANEQALPQIEIEANNLSQRLEKLYSRDAKILATTYEYASSGIKTLPLLRFIGNGFWNLGMLQELKTAYRVRFQRDLPVSALGQSKTHDRMGWDHTNAADVALHPGTTEGQWLVTYLKDQGIPFIAFRSAMSGHSTGPHVHVGLASKRLRR